ncbi:Proto-oncogene tyrosine- kinase receptor Ret, partial [Paramuricea clavata]
MPPKLEVTALETKITQLKRAIGKTETIVNNGKEQAIVRHVDTIKETLSEINKLRREIEATKISEGVNDDEIDEWNSEIESVMESGDEAIEKLQEWLKTKEFRLEEIQHEQKAEREKQEQEKRIEFELKLHEAKIKMQAEAEVSVKPTSGKEEDEVSKLQAKLPKLQISEFNASYKDWPRFWNLYSETIHKSSIPAVSKFSYLKELLCEKARKTIEALPHTAEGYNRATAILKDRFGKECEIVKCFVKEIMELPHIPTANVKKIHEFHDKLAYCVQLLETLKKLDAVNGTVSMTLEKLPAIRGDLARNDTKWEDWTYIQLTEALQFWTRRNPLDSPKHDDTQKKREQPRGCFHTQQKGGAQPGTRKACVYCDKEEHRSSEYKSVTTVGERRKILARKKLCFNCTGPSHRASDCR